MSLILTRSPYFVSREDLDESATLQLDIGLYDTDLGGINVMKTYNLVFRSSFYIDISPFLRDYLGTDYEYNAFSGNYISTVSGDILYVRTTLSGTKNGVVQSDVVSSSFATDGYLYSEESFNKDFAGELRDNSFYAGSTDLVYKLDDANLSLRLLAVDVDHFSSPSTDYVDVIYKKNSEVLASKRVSFDYDYTRFSLRNVFSSGASSYEARVLDANGVLEETKCLSDFLEDFRLEDYDEVVLASKDGNVKNIKVKTIEECKYPTYRATFKNRYGVDEDLWFFKRSDKSITVNKEQYRSSSIASYSAGDGVKTMINFNVNGQEKIVLNSGFVEEEMYEAFKQLLLSEEVTLYDYNNNKTYQVNLGTSELQYKQHVNDKLINYTIEFEFAHEVINNVG